MEQFSRDEITDLSDELQPLLPDVIEYALIKANDEGKLRELLRWFGLDKMLPSVSSFETSPFGQILIFGDQTISFSDLAGASQSLGVSKQRLKYIDYSKTQKYDIGQLFYNSRVSAILVGAVPHSTAGTGDASSFITSLERHESEGTIYAKVVRLVAGGILKITKSNFKDELIKLIASGKVKKDL